ncbi:MAG: hypothetical protein AB7S38_43440 [Vulcanimicrobiota bacterium]
MRARLFCIALLILGCGCEEPPVWELTVLNMTMRPVVLSDGGTRHINVSALRPHDRLRVERRETLTITQGGKLLETLHPGQPPLDFPEGQDARILYIIGGPAALAMADCSEFYGHTRADQPGVRDYVDLRDRVTCRLDHTDFILWPHQRRFKENYWQARSRHRVVRIVEIKPGDTREGLIQQMIAEGLESQGDASDQFSK